MRYTRVFLCTAMAALGAVGPVRADLFTYTGSAQEYTVQTSGLYYISAAGAQGGNGYGEAGGLGASLSGDYFLTAGTQLQIIVGGQGLAPQVINNNMEGGGGGGSFVFISGAAQPLIVAGGGGGGGVYASLGVSDGQITTYGAAGHGPYSGAGGTGGSGGAGGGFSEGQNGGGGAGWLSNGGSGNVSPPNYYGSGSGGLSAPTFAGGSSGGVISGNGGFGGGGGGGESGGGGGGGYSGGGGASAYGGGGGGGGSYLDSGFTNTSGFAGVQAGNGVVQIGLIAAPEPSSFALMGTGLICLLGFLRWTRYAM